MGFGGLRMTEDGCLQQLRLLLQVPDSAESRLADQV